MSQINELFIGRGICSNLRDEEFDIVTDADSERVSSKKLILKPLLYDEDDAAKHVAEAHFVLETLSAPTKSKPEGIATGRSFMIWQFFP